MISYTKFFGRGLAVRPLPEQNRILFAYFMCNKWYSIHCTKFYITSDDSTSAPDEEALDDEVPSSYPPEQDPPDLSLVWYQYVCIQIISRMKYKLNVKGICTHTHHKGQKWCVCMNPHTKVRCFVHHNGLLEWAHTFCCCCMTQSTWNFAVSFRECSWWDRNTQI